MFAGYLRLNPPGAFASERASYREKNFLFSFGFKDAHGSFGGAFTQSRGRKGFCNDDYERETAFRQMTSATLELAATHPDFHFACAGHGAC